ncbi:OPT oligopeptide transporter [Aspergillus ruber CBS 135680]|uniref:OPT oligopeptide transporter n=1 Tax=Aspergillus ruber (strain CBS 135680) TaxID=1388766 RepID=A0A017SPT4_ASPRC|nr:OPT oligopeptide transporter [Aspergillus ruber CBS 135680]EYE98609.1 OPT oligopeptide transporter [Aspergillus ruber CBS 135680]
MAATSEKIGKEIIQPVTVEPNTQEDDLDFKLEGDEFAKRLSATVDEVLAAREHSHVLSLEEARKLAQEIVDTHSHDPNFPSGALDRMTDFLNNAVIFEAPEKHRRAIEEAKIEVSLLTSNSPYSEVRAVVDPYDNPELPLIGLGFVITVAFVNQLFSVHQPSIFIGAPVVQFLAYPVGKAAEKFLPDVGFILFGVRHSLNPGPFNKKEHMLISIMASVGKTLPSSRYIIFTQWLDKYFGQPYARSFGYQILLALSTNLMGFGLAGLCRRFLVYPSFCLWPRSLVTIALNSSLHNEENYSVLGPFQQIFNISRFRLFIFPDYIFSALSLFNWIAWIAPNNYNLTAITGIKKGLGFNPMPTFDWNIVTHVLDPLIVPFHVTINTFFGVLLGGIVIIGMYWTNAYHTGYLPINTNSMHNHFGNAYNVSIILDERGWLDEAKYQAYSPVYLAASSLTMYFFFSAYAATVSYTFLYHRHDIVLGFKSLVKSFKKKGRLMSVYREVPEWWCMILNIVAIALSIAAVFGWPTYTTVGVIFFGILLALVFTIPTNVIAATTGMEVEFNVLAEFIGGVWQPGNALAMNFFKCFGYITTAHALDFANDLKLAHYVKVPPRQTFWAQVVAVFISALVTAGVMNFQIMNIPDLCESIGARRVFGSGGHYTSLLSAFLIGFALPFIFYFIQRRVPRIHWFNKVHPVMLLTGGVHWSPYNIAYIWPAVLPAYISMKYLRSRYLAFWAKYNYVLSAALSTTIAIAVDWWGNDSESGCEASACTRLTVPKDEYFGPRVGNYT